MPPFDQSRYQVRFDWGIPGLRRLAPADITVVVDVLRFSTRVAQAVDQGDAVALDQSERDRSINGAVVSHAAADAGSLVLLGSLTNPAAVADAVLAEQTRRGARTSIAVVAAGERVLPADARSARAAGPTVTASEPPAAAAVEELRFSVEDLFGAGAVIDALAALGLDHSSPEAAAACEAFRGLRPAVRHLLTASGSGQELIDHGLRDDVIAAAAVDSVGAAPVLRDGVFVAAPR